MSDSSPPCGLHHTRRICPTISWSLLKFMFTESVMLSNHLILRCSLPLCLQPFPASGSFPVSLLFVSGGQSIGASVSGSVLPMNIWGWFPLGLTGLISLLSKGRFSSTTVWKHQFFGAQASLWSNSPVHTWLLEKPGEKLEKEMEPTPVFLPGEPYEQYEKVTLHLENHGQLLQML